MYNEVILPETAWTNYWLPIVSDLYIFRSPYVIVDSNFLLKCLRKQYDVTEEHFNLIEPYLINGILSKFESSPIKGELVENDKFRIRFTIK